MNLASYFLLKLVFHSYIFIHIKQKSTKSNILPMVICNNDEECL